MNAFRLLICVLLVCSTFASAQDRPGERRRFGGGYGGGGFRRFEPTEQEWMELSAFMKEISPRRWEIFENLPDNSVVRDRTRSLFVSRYRMLVKTKSEDPALYETLVNRVKLEDTIFEAVASIKKAVADSAQPSEIEALRKDLKTMVSTLVDLGIKERRHRIDKMERTLQNERQKLREDEQNRDAVIADRMKRFEMGHDGMPRSEGQPAPTEDAAATQAGANPDGAAEQQPQ